MFIVVLDVYTLGAAPGGVEEELTQSESFARIALAHQYTWYPVGDSNPSAKRERLLTSPEVQRGSELHVVAIKEYSIAIKNLSSLKRKARFATLKGGPC